VGKEHPTKTRKDRGRTLRKKILICISGQRFQTSKTPASLGKKTLPDSKGEKKKGGESTHEGGEKIFHPGCICAGEQ